MNKDLGLIHIYCGDGKGKTTAAFGLAVRAAGAGLKVAVLQFLKSGTSSEIQQLKKMENIRIIPPYLVGKFTFQMNDEEKALCKQEQTKVFQSAVREVIEKGADLFILDEVIGALGTGTLCEEIFLEFLKNKPPHLEVVMTGRNPAPELLELADYVTEMKKRKHPFDAGIQARKGIEK